MARSTRSRYLALVACLTLFLAGVPGVGTSLAQSVEPTNPWVGIAPDGDAMWGGSGWTQGNTVAISIDDPDPGDDDYATNVTVGPDEWSLELEGVFDIQPGHLVTATDTDASITKTHEVRGFTVESVDTDSDTIAGTAPVGTALTVKTFSPESCDTIVTADQDGNWEADFAGLLSDGGQPCDLGPGWHGSAEWYDATDNDHTLMGWGVEDAPTPTFTVETPWDVWSSGEAWVEDDTITLTIGGVTVATTTVERWGPEPWEVGFNFHTEGEHEIIPGDTVTVTAANAGTVKTLDVVAITVTAVNEVDDTVSGTAPAGSRVEVNGGNEFSGAHRSVQADGSGVWTADFSAPGIEDHEQDILDIAPGVGGSAEVYDDDQDSTHRGWRVASPWIGVNVTHDELWANDWPLGETLQYTIEDPDTAASPDKSGDMLVVTGGGGQTEAGDRMFDGFDIHAGQVLTVWNGTMSRELLISNLEVTDVDPDTDTMLGTADPGTRVCASTFNAQLCVNADENGDWTADFSTVGSNVRPGDHNGASQEDDDGDQTHFSWHVPPWIYVELAERDAAGDDLYPDRIQLDQWEGPQVTVRVNGLVIATPTVGSEEGYSMDHDVQVGDIIEVFDPAGPTTTQDITKTLEIEDLYITDLTRFDEIPPSTVFGEAAPTGGERSVQANISTEYGWWADRWVNSDAAGAWEADFANPGFGWHEQWTSSFGAGGVTDVLNGGAVRSAIWDSDNDQTQAVWHPTNPRVIVIQGDPDQVEAIDFPEGSAVTVEIDDPVTPESPDWEDSGIAAVDPDKPWSTLLVFELVDYNIPEAATVTASDGVTDVIHDVVSFTIDAVDPDADTVSGTAAAGTEVLVEADGNWRYPIADVDGDWTADFSVPGEQPGEEQPVDIQPGSSGRAVVVGTNGSATTLIWQLAQLPSFSVRVDEGQIHGYQWPDGAEVTLEIADPSNGGTYSGTATSSAGEWDPEQTYVDFAPGEEGFTLAAGQTVTMTHGDVTKTTVITDLTITSVDEAADTVSGTTTSGTDFVDIGIHDEIGTWRQVTAVGGTWVADFSVPWQDQPTWDIAPGTQGEANESDEDGDTTNRSWRIVNPAFSVETLFDVWSNGDGWVEDDTVTMTVDDPSNGVGVDYTDQTTVQRWGPEPWEVGFNFHTEPFEIQPGYTVTITATEIIKTLDVVDITVDTIDEDVDTVSGTAPTDAWVDVNAGNNTGDAQRTVQADGSGAWTADFSTPGTEGHEQNTLDIEPGTGGSAQVFDDDGDSAHRGWELRIPSLGVHLPNNQIGVGGFAPNAPVDVAVDDDGDPANGVLWSQGGSTDGDGNAWFHPDGLQIEHGMTVTAESPGILKSMVVTSVRITGVDYDNDRVFGMADPLSEVRAEVRWDGSEGDNHRIVHADASGNWMADYTLPGDEQSPDPVDLETWMEVSAEQTDEDNDQTVFNWRVANPSFSVETPFDVWSSSQDWVEGDTVSLSIDDPAVVDGEYTSETTVQRWGPDPSEVGFNFHTEPFEIQPGFEVVITSGDTVRILDVVGITIDTIDETTGKVSGTAPGGSWVDVNAGNNTGDAQRTVQAASSGTWTADFSTPGTEGHEQNTLDITPGTGGSAQVFDDDGDSTHRGWCFECEGGDIQPIPPIEMEPGEILISQTDGVLWVYDPETGSLEDHPLPFGGIWDIQWLGSDQVLIANSAAAQIWILDLTTGDFELLAGGDPFQFPIGLALDPAVENLWVADGRSGIIRFNDDGAEVVVEPFGSPDGIVVADDGTVYFTAQGGTLYRVDETLPGNYAEVATAEGYGLNGLVMRPDGRVLATSMGPSALITFDPSAGTVSVEDYRTEMRTSEDSVFAANGDIYVADSGMVDEFGDDPGLYVRRATGGLEQLLRGEPLGDTVDLLIYEPSPRLQVYSTSTIPGYTDVVYAESVSADSTLTIEREGDPLSPYVFDPTEFDGGTATWTLSGIFDIVAGDVVTAGAGDRTITHTVTPLAITGIDHATYTISGVARPGHVLAFNMVPLDPDGGYGALLTRQIPTDPVSGAWSVTLTDPPGPDEEGTVQFGPDGFPGSHGNIYDSDPDGSAETTLDWFVAPDLAALRNPQGIDDTGDMLMGRGWSLSETIEVDVADAGGSAALSTQASAEWDCGSSCLQQGTWALDDLGFTLDPGMTVTGYQEWPSHLDPPSSWTTTLEVQPLTVDLVDVVNDVVAGTADPFATVTVVQPSGSDATDEDHVVSIVVADLNGRWSADFNGLWDVGLGDIGTAGVPDTEGMDTRVLWQAPDPLVAVGIDPDGISGRGWLWDRDITLTVDDLGTPEMPDLTVPATSDAAGSVEFDLGAFELQPGMEVSVTDGILNRATTIADYAYSPDPQSDPGVFVDPDTDTVSGMAPAGSEVCVHIDGAAAPICISVLGSPGTIVPWSISIPGGISYTTVCEVTVIFDFTIQTVTVPADPPPTIDDVTFSTEPGSSDLSFHAVDYGDYSCTDPYLLSVEIDWGDGTQDPTEYVAPHSTIYASHAYGKTGTYVITVTVTEPCELQEFTSTLTVDIPNTAPAITALTGPVDPVAIGTEISVSGEFVDPNWLDEHSLVVEWGDGTNDTVAPATSPFTVGHTYTEPGVYRIEATVADDEGGTGTAEYAFTVVYDPLGGFATGAGTIESPVGAYVPDSALTGTASFGFVSKYKKGATTPSGTTEFEFAAGDVFFWSRTFDWLVIAGPKAQFKGAGTINGLGDFGFMVTAVDAKLTESTDVDLFRIKIWDRVTGDVVYDNLLDADDDADPTTEIDSGDIVIHKAKPDKRK